MWYILTLTLGSEQSWRSDTSLARTSRAGLDSVMALLRAREQECVADRVMRCNSSPKLRAHFEVVHCRPRENALDAITTVVRVRHADVSRKAELLDDDPSKLSLREGEGLDHRDCEERETLYLAWLT